MITPFLYINYTDPYVLQQYLASLGVTYQTRRNPSEDDALLKRYLNIIIGQARALGWNLSKRYDGWKPETLSTGLRQLSINDAKKLIQNQAKLILSFAPITKCKKLDGTEISLPMVPMLNKKKEIHWGIPTFWEGKGKNKKYYVLGKDLEKIYTRTVTKKRGYARYTDADCTEYGGIVYSEVKARASFAPNNWPVAFIPSEWADKYKYSALLKEFDGGVISIIDNQPSQVVAPQNVTRLADIDEALAAAPDIKDAYQTPTGNTVEELPFDPKSTDPYEWQQLAIERWVDNDFRGLVEACTGSGKTKLCTEAIKRVLEEMPSTHVSIVVPKIALLNQWYGEIIKDLEVWFEGAGLGDIRSHISRHGGNYKNKEIKKIAIYVINTAKDVLPEIKMNHPELPSLHFLIVDEAHRSTSPTFKDIYLCDPDYRLAVTATFPEDIKRFEILEENVGELLCVYRYAHALLKGIISPFKLTFLETKLIPMEMDIYEELTEKIREFARMADREGASPEKVKKGVTKTRKKKGQDDGEDEDEVQSEPFAVKMMKILGGARARISWSAVNRLGCALHYIATALDEGKKIIVFHKSTDGAAALFNLMQNRGYEVGLYHSAQGAHINDNYLQAFHNNKIRCLLSVESLLEGLNVPDADVGLAVAADQSRIKIVQSLGRVLRVNPNNPLKEFYLITVGPDESTGELLPWVANAFKDAVVKAKFINSLLDKEGNPICPIETIACAFTSIPDVAALHSEAGLPMNKYVAREAEKGKEVPENSGVKVQHPKWALRSRRKGQQRRR